MTIYVVHIHQSEKKTTSLLTSILLSLVIFFSTQRYLVLGLLKTAENQNKQSTSAKKNRFFWISKSNIWRSIKKRESKISCCCWMIAAHAGCLLVAAAFWLGKSVFFCCICEAQQPGTAPAASSSSR